MNTAASRDVNWMLETLPGKQGLLTPKSTLCWTPYEMS